VGVVRGLVQEQVLHDDALHRGETRGDDRFLRLLSGLPDQVEIKRHLAVAAAIASGVADVGIGIEAAARRLKLDFIPLFVEDYYLLGKRETFERADVESIVASLKSQEFSAHVRGIPGYDTSRTGEISNVSDVIG
jgi:molybdate-binding protein